MNYILAEHIVYLSEKKSRLDRLKSMVNNWRTIAFFSLLTITVKSAIEQIILAIR